MAKKTDKYIRKQGLKNIWVFQQKRYKRINVHSQMIKNNRFGQCRNSRNSNRSRNMNRIENNRDDCRLRKRKKQKQIEVIVDINISVREERDQTPKKQIFSYEHQSIVFKLLFHNMKKIIFLSVKFEFLLNCEVRPSHKVPVLDRLFNRFTIKIQVRELCPIIHGRSLMEHCFCSDPT